MASGCAAPDYKDCDPETGDAGQQGVDRDAADLLPSSALRPSNRTELLSKLKGNDNNKSSKPYAMKAAKQQKDRL